MNRDGAATLEVIDSHTGGEPTRIVVAGGPDLGPGSVAERLKVLRRDRDWLRSAVVHEPRGSDVMVGALLVEPAEPGCAAGVIFFNNVGYLGMCGHGTIGLAVTLAHLGRVGPGTFRVETSVGVVSVALEDPHTAAIDNVPAHRLRKLAAVDVPGHGVVRGDVAWGGNWFFLIYDGHGQELSVANAPRLTAFASAVKSALAAQGITGAGGAEIDHVELFGPPADAANHSRNFVLCPGDAYDRSPCGTGTSAKLACLAADGKLAPGEVYRQESILGSVFEASYRLGGEGRVLPRIRGRAYVNARSTLILDPDDPFRFGIRAGGRSPAA